MIHYIIIDWSLKCDPRLHLWVLRGKMTPGKSKILNHFSWMQSLPLKEAENSRELQNSLSPYREIYNDLVRTSKRTKITMFFKEDRRCKKSKWRKMFRLWKWYLHQAEEPDICTKQRTTSLFLLVKVISFNRKNVSFEQWWGRNLLN